MILRYIQTRQEIFKILVFEYCWSYNTQGGADKLSYRANAWYSFCLHNLVVCIVIRPMISKNKHFMLRYSIYSKILHNSNFLCWIKKGCKQMWVKIIFITSARELSWQSTWLEIQSAREKNLGRWSLRAKII